LRKLAITLLAVPVLAIVYASSALRRSILARAGFAAAIGLFVGVGIILAARPAPVAATPPSVDLPLTAANFRTIVTTDRGLQEPVTIEFSSPMNEASVTAALSVEPPVAVDLRWDIAGSVLTITPRAHWDVATYHTVTVDAGALAANGSPMISPARAAFLTRGVTTASIAASKLVGDRVALDAALDITLTSPTDETAVQTAFRITPAVAGTISATSSASGATTFRFVPTAPLASGTAYTVTLNGLVDADGLSVEPLTTTIRTATSTKPSTTPGTTPPPVTTPGGKAPQIVRFRPFEGTSGIARTALLSVRFTLPMDRTTTGKAWSVTAGGKKVAGSVRFAEGDTVLVFDPAKSLPYGVKVVMTVSTKATTKTGVALAKVAHGTFKTAAKPTAKSSGGSGGGSGGGSVGGGSWGSVETYYLGLMNCTRTGGWVTSSGNCSSPGGRDVAPLKLDAGISTNVSRPYAKKLAVGGDCDHFIGGNPGDRLRHAGYDSYRWAENLGCRSGNPRSAVLGSHLFFQAEKSANGGHYVNLMNPMYDRVGIGVWVSHGRVRLVIDFYHA
jgi:uncharacterized protein YkwD